MRRPLFGNGFPRNILTADGTVEVLDTEDLDEGLVYALTLFMWPYQPGPGPFDATTNPAFTVGVSTNGGAVVPLVAYLPPYITSLFNSPNGPAPIEPIKVLDRLMLRGRQRVTMANANAGSAACRVWGYFEAVGEQDVGVPFRGLQPGALAEPYTFPPLAFDLVGANQNGAGVLHKLDPAYVDLVTIDISNMGAGDTSGNGFSSGLFFPGGDVIPMPSIDIFLAQPPSPIPATGLVRKRILDGIPMRALNNTDAGSNILFGGGTTVDGTALSIRAYGSFMRY
jgi:hypothetical protein